jgi:hypothetical protein
MRKEETRRVESSQLRKKYLSQITVCRLSTTPILVSRRGDGTHGAALLLHAFTTSTSSLLLLLLLFLHNTFPSHR